MNWEHVKARNAALDNSMQPLGKMQKSGTRIYRKVGQVWVNEIFIRCFPADSEWRSGSSTDALQLIGIVMPVRDDGKGEVLSSATDAEVFAPESREANGFYLETTESMESRSSDLGQEIESLEDRIESLEAERDEAQEELTKLNAEIASRQSAAK